MLVQAVGGAAASRIPLEISLAALAEEKGDPRLAAAAERLASRLQQGATIHEAIDSLDRQLPTEVAGLLRAGIESGDLAGTFERFGQQRLASERFNRRIRGAIAYPLLVLCILVPLLPLLEHLCHSDVSRHLPGLNLYLPPLTELILQRQSSCRVWLLEIVLVVIGAPLILRIVGGRWLLHRVPVFANRLWGGFGCGPVSGNRRRNWRRSLVSDCPCPVR